MYMCTFPSIIFDVTILPVVVAVVNIILRPIMWFYAFPFLADALNKNLKSPPPCIFPFLPFEIALINSSTISAQMLDVEPAQNVTRPISPCLGGAASERPKGARAAATDRQTGLSALLTSGSVGGEAPSRPPHLDPARGQGFSCPGPAQPICN